MRPHREPGEDAEGFTDFMSQCAHRLYRVAYLLTGDPGQAEELTQSALVRTYASWHRVRHEDGYAYARRVLVNLHTDSWRGWLRWERPVAQPPERYAADDPADLAVSREQLAAALRRLTRRERAVIVCRYFLDLTEQQTAEELDVAVGTVKSANARALAKLRIAPDLAIDSGLPDPLTEGAS
jgi:RNA polymerase sigma-70 factor (sigma-E family)